MIRDEFNTCLAPTGAGHPLLPPLSCWPSSTGQDPWSQGDHPCSALCAAPTPVQTGKACGSTAGGLSPSPGEAGGCLLLIFPRSGASNISIPVCEHTTCTSLCCVRGFFRIALLMSNEIYYCKSSFAPGQPFQREMKLQSMALSRHFLPASLLCLILITFAKSWRLFWFSACFFLDLFQMTIYLLYHRVFYSIHHCSIYTLPC